ncbi:hypothetical protein P7K49_038960, partial [Saguinus oedipus]
PGPGPALRETFVPGHRHGSLPSQLDQEVKGHRRATGPWGFGPKLQVNLQFWDSGTGSLALVTWQHRHG